MSTPNFEDDDMLLLGNLNALTNPPNELDTSRLRSEIWKHYRREKVGDNIKAICNYCKSQLVGGPNDGTSHLRNHLKRCSKSKSIQTDLRQYKLGQPKIDGQMDLLAPYAFDQNVSRTKLAHMIVMHEYPLSMVEHKGFRDFSASLQLAFKPVSRNTIKREIMQIYGVEKMKTTNILETSNSSIALTTDLWTASSQRKGYMAVTAHFVDEAWRLHSRILRFIYVPCPHTAETICDALYDFVINWNLDRRLSTLTVDNCSTNDKVIELMLEKLNKSDLWFNGQLFHMRYSAHILNLIVKDDLSVIGDGIDRIRDSVAYWVATPKRIEKFIEMARQMNIQCNQRLALDCKTRWNSTYLILTTALKFKTIFSRLAARERQYKNVPNDKDWELAATLEDNLKKFYEVTEKFSGTQYPTTNLFFVEACEIRLSLLDWLESDSEVVQMMAKKMIAKFDQYWGQLHGVLAIAIILDPRYKLKLLRFYFDQLFDSSNLSFNVTRAYSICRDLVNEYTSKAQVGGSSSSCYRSPSRLSSKRKSGRLAYYDDYVSEHDTTFSKSELDVYLDEKVLPNCDNLDILMWWKTNGSKYLILARIAIDVYAIPISTVASESAFSIGGKVVSPHRSKLHPSTLEALMCTQNWLLAEKRGLDKKVQQDDCYEEDSDGDGEGVRV